MNLEIGGLARMTAGTTRWNGRHCLSKRGRGQAEGGRRPRRGRATAVAETVQLSTRAAAGELNRRGIKTASGKQWHAMSVHRARQRLGL